MPQQRGKTVHLDIDTFGKSPDNPEIDLLKGIYVISTRLGVYGKIDTYSISQKKLVESKFLISTIYRGYYYQLWSQYYALREMGYSVDNLAFYSIKDDRHYPIGIPTEAEFQELRSHIQKIARFDFESEISVNPAKCRHCIYASLCDKTQIDHVYA